MTNSECNEDGKTSCTDAVTIMYQDHGKNCHIESFKNVIVLTIALILNYSHQCPSF